MKTCENWMNETSDKLAQRIQEAILMLMIAEKQEAEKIYRYTMEQLSGDNG